MRLSRLPTLIFLAMTLTSSLFARDSFSSVGLHPTAYPLGKGGSLIRTGLIPYNGRLPHLNRPALLENITVGGIQTRREISYIADVTLIPFLFGFGVGSQTDFYLSAGIGSGTSQKRVANFYGVPPDVYAKNPDSRYDRIYSQPLFDVGLAIFSQLKPELGDGLPAVGVRVSGRFGYTADDHNSFKDLTPEDGFPDFGGDLSILASQQFGEYLALHGSLTLSSSRKLGPRLLYGGALEFVLIPHHMTLSADFKTQHEFVGNEFSQLPEKLVVAVRYHVRSGLAAELASSLSGHLFLTLTRLGTRPSPIVPHIPRSEDVPF